MTLGEIKDQVMFQTNNDADDVGDFLPHLVDYVNEGYDLLMNAWNRTHIPAAEYDRLENDSDEPELPEWIHRSLADWATWLVYRNGNPNKQQRGYPFRTAFDEVLARIRGEGGEAGLNEDGSRKIFNKFRNIPR